MDITLISAPFDQDKYNTGMGLTPAALLQAGLIKVLEGDGHNIVGQKIIPEGLGDGDQIDRLINLNKQISDHVYESRQSGSFPLILGGDCLLAIGVNAGLSRAFGVEGFGIAWYDSHGDFNTPDISLSGHLPGMALACCCGYGLEKLRSESGLLTPVNSSHVIMLGVRDLDPHEKVLLDSTPISYLNPDEVKTGAASTAAGYHFQEVEAVYLHLDIDSIDPSEAPGLSFPVPNGLFSQSAIAAGKTIQEISPLAALCLTMLNTEKDIDNKTLELAIKLIREILSPSPAQT